MNSKVNSFQHLKTNILTSKQTCISKKPVTSTLLDKMEDGREFESLLKYQYQNLNFLSELRKVLPKLKQFVAEK